MDGCGFTALFEYSLHLPETEKAEASELGCWKRKSVDIVHIPMVQKREHPRWEKRNSIQKRAILLEFLGRESGLEVYCLRASFFL